MNAPRTQYRMLFEKMTVANLRQKYFYPFYGTRSLIVCFTAAAEARPLAQKPHLFTTHIFLSSISQFKVFYYSKFHVKFVSSAIAQSLQRHATGWTVRESIPGVGEVFRIRPDQPWGTHSLLYRICFPEVKRPGVALTTHPPPNSPEVKEKVDLYVYPVSGPPWLVIARSLPLNDVRFVIITYYTAIPCMLHEVFISSYFIWSP